MRIAVIADIHGNLHALHAVLADIDRLGVDQVIVNGDLVNRGPNNIAVLDLLAERDYTVTLGNHDDLIRMWSERDSQLPSSWYSDPFWCATAYITEQLEKAGWIDYLRQLPMTHTIATRSAPRILIAHGSPRYYREGYAVYSDPRSLQEICNSYEADIFIGSHTHRPFDTLVDGRRFVNTGAVGAPFNLDPRAQYLLLTLRKHVWQIEFRAVAYDRQAAIDAFEKTGYLRAGWLSAHIFCEELIQSRPLFDPFWRWTHEHKKPRNWASWQSFCALPSYRDKSRSFVTKR